MFSLTRVFRTFAVLLLFSAALCFSADMVQDLSHAKTTSAQTDSCPDDGASGFDCFCCCSHFVPSTYAPGLTISHFRFIEPPVPESAILLPPTPLFRPPRV